MDKPLNLTTNEQERLTKAIEDAQQRLYTDYGEDITRKEALALLRETIYPVIVDILKAHKSERLLN